LYATTKVSARALEFPEEKGERFPGFPPDDHTCVPILVGAGFVFGVMETRHSILTARTSIHPWLCAPETAGLASFRGPTLEALAGLSPVFGLNLQQTYSKLRNARRSVIIRMISSICHNNIELVATFPKMLGKALLKGAS